MNSLQVLSDSPAIQRLGWTILHSAWQAAAVAICLAFVLPSIRRRSAHAAYLVAARHCF